MTAKEYVVFHGRSVLFYGKTIQSAHPASEERTKDHSNNVVKFGCELLRLLYSLLFDSSKPDLSCSRRHVNHNYTHT